MRVNKKQHELLQLLYDYDRKFIASNGKIAHGLNWEEISKGLGVTKEQLDLIAGRLVTEEDIEGETRMNPPLYSICKPKGIASLGEKKYLKDSKNWLDHHPKSWDLVKIIITAILTGSISLWVGSEIAQQKAQDQQRLDKQQDTAIHSLHEQLKNLQSYQKDSSKRK